ncbi:ferrochelatase [Chitinimonas arctica]|uniref:Ferrochelatase n=1 Tax=Chitinimonas arctica TaxID=2594795 RepID=A0A516SGX6_9NEIS|nr:ferrochelatase [Chitinimonas arctica]QDQ27414.1 ferrochelatase [Chitinimonas arctica]
MPYQTEPDFRHDQASRVGLLLVNLGTPEAPTAAAVRPYLKQFLSDPRVVEIPRLVWWFILNGIILNTRPKKSAAKYASIWSRDGSPLAVHTRAQAKLLQGFLGNMGQNVVVDWAMRYGQPSVADKMMALKAAGCDRVLVLPLYPQYAASSTGSVMDAVADAIKTLRNPPELRIVKHFHDAPDYIGTLARRVEAHWIKQGRGDHLLMSFHGIPRFSLDKGDPYHCECHKTARLLAERLGLAAGKYTVSFQSRFGKTEWLKPYTSVVLTELGRKKTGKLDVICPGFVSDCLETLEEIAIEGKAEFMTAGGGEYRYIPALNAEPDWIAALGKIAAPHLGGWSLEPEEAGERKARAARATVK